MEELFITVVSTVPMVIVSLLALALYFLPTIISFNKKHSFKVVILVVNLFTGWFGIGWIICLIIVLCTKGEQKTI